MPRKSSRFLFAKSSKEFEELQLTDLTLERGNLKVRVLGSGAEAQVLLAAAAEAGKDVGKAFTRLRVRRRRDVTIVRGTAKTGS